MVSGITVTATASGQSVPNLIPQSGLVITGQGTANQTLTITPGANLPSLVTASNGTATITLTLTDGSGNVTTESFPLTVISTVVPPTINLSVADTNTPANFSLNIPFTLTDIQETTNLSVTVTSSTNTLGFVDIISNSTTSYDLTFTPIGPIGTVVATLVATDGSVLRLTHLL